MLHPSMYRETMTRLNPSGGLPRIGYGNWKMIDSDPHSARCARQVLSESNVINARGCRECIITRLLKYKSCHAVVGSLQDAMIHTGASVLRGSIASRFACLAVLHLLPASQSIGLASRGTTYGSNVCQVCQLDISRTQGQSRGDQQNEGERSRPLPTVFRPRTVTPKTAA